MTDYTNTFTSITGDIVTASELDAQFDNIATSILSKANAGNTAMTGTPTVNAKDVWHQGNQSMDNPLDSYGYQILPNGQIFQWGWGTAGPKFGASPGTIVNNFTIPYPNAQGPTIARHNGGLGNGSTNIAVGITTLSTFELGSFWSVPISCFWIGFGY